MAESIVPFVDFDDQIEFDNAFSKAKAQSTRNFVIDFNVDQAKCAFDLDEVEIESLLEPRTHNPPSSQPASYSTRWIHIWRPEDQKHTIEAVAKHYGFSPRLTLSMTADPMKPQPVSNTLSRSSSRYRDLLRPNRSKRSLVKNKNSEKSIISDLESKDQLGSEAILSALDLSHYRIVNELWHFMSVDWGHKYTSIGYNALYNTKARIDLDEFGSSHSRPSGTRVWWWIVLCNDGTVLSIQENAFPGLENLNPSQQRQLESVRYNCLNLFKQLSKATIHDQQSSALTTVAVRSGRLPITSENDTGEGDSPSLLVYYLFDDWYSIYSLIAKSEHQYRVQLDKIRQEMFSSAKLEHIHKLHSLGRQLATLKRMYEGYELIIERVIHGPQQSTKKKILLHTDTNLSRTSQQNQDAIRKASEVYGVPISLAAALRFERLADRIKLYALSEIKSCLEEKESLMAMNFNLIAIKEESYIERLTRVTILLAKVTILFIPVSIMATYFAIPFEGIQYQPPQFWTAFAVLFTTSSIGLVIFGILSGTQEAGPLYKSLTQSRLDVWRTIRGKREKRLE